MNKRFDPKLLGPRVAIALLFLIAGVRKVMAYGGTVAYFGKLGVVMPEVVVPLTILLEIGGGIAIVAGWKLRVVAPAMAVFTVVSAIIGHAFWAADAATFTPQLNNFLKNLAIAGAFIALAIQAREDERVA